MTAWADPSWSPFGVADEPVYEPEIEFGTAVVYNALADAPVLCGITTPHNHSSFDDPIDCAWRNRISTPALDDTGAPVLEWEVATREQLGDGDTVRVTQVGRWKGTRLTGKTVHYERKTV